MRMCTAHVGDRSPGALRRKPKTSQNLALRPIASGVTLPKEHRSSIALRASEERDSGACLADTMAETRYTVSQMATPKVVTITPMMPM